MTEVSIRDLGNNGGDVVDRAFRGELIAITRVGKRVADLRPGPSSGLTAPKPLLERWRNLPPLDPGTLRPDIDDLLDTGL